MISYRQTDFQDYMEQSKAPEMYDELVRENGPPLLHFTYNPLDDTASVFSDRMRVWGLSDSDINQIAFETIPFYHSGLSFFDTNSQEDMMEKMNILAKELSTKTKVPATLPYRITTHKQPNVDDRVNIYIKFERPE